MSLFVDPSETRTSTRLPQGIVEAGKVLPGLEAITGADLLISPLNSPPLESLGPARPQQLALEYHCKAGLLVQRKTGRDLSSSIPALSDILAKMRRWSEKPWLLFIGDLKCDRNGMAIIDGFDTGFTYNAVQGALESWQLRGGYISILSRDMLIASWIQRWLDKLQALQASPEKLLPPRPVQQPIVGEDVYRAQAMRTLMTIKDVGPEKAGLILDHCGLLAYSLVYLSRGEGQSLKGIGPKTFENAQKLLFRDDGKLQLEVISKEEPLG